MLYTSFKFWLVLLSVLVLQVSLHADDSLENSKEFQRILEEARKSNKQQDIARDLRRKKEAEEARKEALLKIKKEKIKFINFTGKQIAKQSVDFIDIGSARIQKGYIEFFIVYKSRETGSQVFWKDGKAELNCKAYSYKGELLGNLKNKKVNSSKQSFYIKGALAGTLKCNLDFYGKTFSESTNFQ